jgi:D-alanine transaminase
VKPITKIDGAPVGNGQVGPVVRKLFEVFARHVKGAMRNAA